MSDNRAGCTIPRGLRRSLTDRLAAIIPAKLFGPFVID
jgi:hypothetical protein